MMSLTHFNRNLQEEIYLTFSQSHGKIVMIACHQEFGQADEPVAVCTHHLGPDTRLFDWDAAASYPIFETSGK